MLIAIEQIFDLLTTPLWRGMTGQPGYVKIRANDPPDYSLLALADAFHSLRKLVPRRLSWVGRPFADFFGINNRGE